MPSIEKAQKTSYKGQGIEHNRYNQTKLRSDPSEVKVLATYNSHEAENWSRILGQSNYSSPFKICDKIATGFVPNHSPNLAQTLILVSYGNVWLRRAIPL